METQNPNSTPNFKPLKVDTDWALRACVRLVVEGLIKDRRPVTLDAVWADEIFKQTFTHITRDHVSDALAEMAPTFGWEVR